MSKPSGIMINAKNRGSVSARGFSLVEITIALGLFTFAAVTILALLPTGLNAMRLAMNQTVEAQIVRTIAGQSVVTNFDALTDRSPFYFDDEGLSTSPNQNRVYTVTVTREDPDFPGSGLATNQLNQSLTKLRIEILEQRSATDEGRTSIYSLHVANYGK